MNAKAKDIVLYLRDPEALPALGFARDERIDPALSKAVEEKAAVLERAPTLERAATTAPVQPSPDMVNSERLEAAARAEDQWLGIKRGSGDDTLAPEASTLRLTQSHEQGIDQRRGDVPVPAPVKSQGGQNVQKKNDERAAFDARVKFHIARLQAIAEDKELGIVRPHNEDPLSPAAIKQREAVRDEKQYKAFVDKVNADVEAAEKARGQKEGPTYTRTGGKGGISRF